MRVEDLRSLPLFGDLSDDQITQLIAAGTVVRIVVERHHGTITIDSRPGATALHVRLPATPWAARPLPRPATGS